MIAGKIFYDLFFILRLWLRPTAKGRSFSGPNIRLRPKVKIVPTVQHWIGAINPSYLFLADYTLAWAFVFVCCALFQNFPKTLEGLLVNHLKTVRQLMLQDRLK